MNVIDRHIRYLLRRDGSVAVPGLGVFVENRISANFDGDSLSAPAYKVSFTHDDACVADSLIASVSRQLSISDEAAAEIVTGEARQWIHQLSLGVGVDIENVGTLRLVTADGTVQFTPCPVKDAWLENLVLNPIEHEAPAAVQVDSEVEENRRRLMQSIARTASSAAAVAIMVLIAFIAAQLPKSTDTAEVQYASLPIEPISNLSIARGGAGFQTESHADHALVLILNTPSDGIAEPTPTQKQIVKSEDDRYCLVVASLYSRGEADKFIASVKADVALDVVENDGRFRVYASQGPTIEAVKADAEARNLYELFPSGWICRK